MHDIEIKQMVKMAVDTRTRAYSPYSKFNVGACIKGESGAYYLGCNIENASFGLSMCAERVAIYKGISDCEKNFQAIAIAADDIHMPYPCGACLQVMTEFCKPTMPVIISNRRGDYEVHTLEGLMPFVFGANNLGGMF